MTGNSGEHCHWRKIDDNYAAPEDPMKRSLVLAMLCISLIAALAACSKKQPLSPIETLGKRLFFDANLSQPPGQSCATCHARPGGWAGPDSEINRTTAVYPGAQTPRFGNRKPPTASYAGFSPKLHINKEGDFVGGMFWDGRAHGHDLGDPLAEQAMGPFLNPLEQNLPDKKETVRRVAAADYAALFREVWGPDSLSERDADAAYVKIAKSIAAYERSHELNPFNSRFDDFWRKAVAAGRAVDKIDEKNMAAYTGLGLSDREVRGLMLFNKKGKCAECHVLTTPGAHPPLLTDFTYDNLGTPRNPRNPFYTQERQWNPDGAKWADPGLGGFLKGDPRFARHAAANMGKHKVPTLRNVDLRESASFVKAYLHNGVFTSLKEVVDFYNTRDRDKKRWGPPEVSANVNTEELGDLKLTDDEVGAIVDFMKTLSDR